MAHGKTLFIELMMMIPQINIKNPSTFNSENLKTKKDIKDYLSGFTQKIHLIYLL